VNKKTILTNIKKKFISPILKIAYLNNSKICDNGLKTKKFLNLSGTEETEYATGVKKNKIVKK